MEVCGHGQVAIDRGKANAIFQYVGTLTNGAGAR